MCPLAATVYAYITTWHMSNDLHATSLYIYVLLLLLYMCPHFYIYILPGAAALCRRPCALRRCGAHSVYIYVFYIYILWCVLKIFFSSYLAQERYVGVLARCVVAEHICFILQTF
jgi:hypothetical protein